MREIPHQETNCLKTAAFGSGLFCENPKSPAPFTLLVCLRTQAGGRFSQGWDVVGAGQGSHAPRPFPGWDNRDGEVAYTASSSLSAHSVVLEPSRSTTVSRHSRLLPSGGCTSGKGKDGVGSSLSHGDAPETLPGLHIPPGTRAGGFSFGSISTCRMQSGSYRLKANTRNELMGRNFHPHGRKDMEGQQTAKNLLKATRLSCLCFELARVHPNFRGTGDAHCWSGIVSSSKSKILNP